MLLPLGSSAQRAKRISGATSVADRKIVPNTLDVVPDLPPAQGRGSSGNAQRGEKGEGTRV